LRRIISIACVSKKFPGIQYRSDVLVIGGSGDLFSVLITEVSKYVVRDYSFINVSAWN